MSKVLAIDTSTSRTSVAIIDGDRVVFSGHRDGATAHGPSLPALVQEALAISEVDEVVVGMGPGPFTGLRVGIAFAQSFAFHNKNFLTKPFHLSRCHSSPSTLTTVGTPNTLHSGNQSPFPKFMIRATRGGFKIQ